eukprot:g3616.t1
MEQIIIKELQNPLIGAEEIKPSVSGVTFRGRSMKSGYAACLWLRTAQRILHVISRGKLSTNKPASQTIREFIENIRDLDKYLGPKQSFGVKSSVWGNTTVKDNHSANHYLRQAILHFTQRKGTGCQWVGELVFIHLLTDFVTRRGYRRVRHSSALTENQAAGLLYLTDWDTISQQEGHIGVNRMTNLCNLGAVFVDPMCGNGTLLCEAALMAKNVAPGLLRSTWSFTQWLDFTPGVWTKLLQEAETKVRRNWSGHILGCDVHPIAVDLAKESRSVISMDQTIKIVHGNCTQWKLHLHPKLVVVNPPWGVRRRSEMPPLELIPLLKQSWKELGQFLWQSCKGAKVYFPCNHPFLYKQLELHVTERSPLWIGGTQLGLYGVHLHNTEALNRHRHKRSRLSPVDLEPRSAEERVMEIKSVQKKLSREISEPMPLIEETSSSSSDEELGVFSNWKLNKYQISKHKS